MNTFKNSKILIFLGHPAHFHLFKNVIRKLKSESVDIDILIVTKDILEDLVKHEGWSYKNIFPKGRRNKHLPILISMIWLQLLSEIRVFWHVIKNRPDLMIGTEGTLAHIGFILRIPSLLVNEDDTPVTPENYLFYPFATKVMVPDCVDIGLWEKKKITYKGYHETFYLDRKYFTPREEVVREFNPSMERYFIIRLVQLGASHDIGKKGINPELAMELISILEKH